MIDNKIWNSCKWFWFSSHRDRIDMLANRVRQFPQTERWKEGMREITPKIIPTTSHPSTRETLMHNNHGEQRGAVAVVFNRSAVIAGRQKKKPRREACSPFHGMRDVNYDFGGCISRQCRRLRVVIVTVVVVAAVITVAVVVSADWKGLKATLGVAGYIKGAFAIMRVIPCAYPVCGYARKLHAPGDIYSEPRGQIIEKTSPQTILTLLLRDCEGRNGKASRGKETRRGESAKYRGARIAGE